MTKRPSFLRSAIVGAAVACAHAARHLVDGLGNRTPVGNAALDAFWDKLFVVFLEVPVLAALRHGGKRAHAAVNLKLPALVNLGLTRTLLTACENGAEHHNVGARCYSLYYIARILNSAVRYDRHVVLLSNRSRVHYCRYLGNANARDNSGGAYGAGPDTDLDAVGSRADKRPGGLCCRDIAGYKLYCREFYFILSMQINTFFE